jgi:hypothetical protein
MFVAGSDFLVSEGFVVVTVRVLDDYQTIDMLWAQSAGYT